MFLDWRPPLEASCRRPLSDVRFHISGSSVRFPAGKAQKSTAQKRNSREHFVPGSLRSPCPSWRSRNVRELFRNGTFRNVSVPGMHRYTSKRYGTFRNVSVNLVHRAHHVHRYTVCAGRVYMMCSKLPVSDREVCSPAHPSNVQRRRKRTSR